MKKLMTIVSLGCMIVTLNCDAQSEISSISSDQQVLSGAPISENPSTTTASTNQIETQSSDVSEVMESNGLSQTKINDKELDLLRQNSEQATDIESTSEMWKILSAENNN